MFNLVYYVLGFAIEEQGFAGRWSADTDKTSIRRQFAALGSGRLPTLEQFVDAVMTAGFDGRFEQGITSILVGLRSNVETVSGM